MDDRDEARDPTTSQERLRHLAMDYPLDVMANANTNQELLLAILGQCQRPTFGKWSSSLPFYLNALGHNPAWPLMALDGAGWLLEFPDRTMVPLAIGLFHGLQNTGGTLSVDVAEDINDRIQQSRIGPAVGVIKPYFVPQQTTLAWRIFHALKQRVWMGADPPPDPRIHAHTVHFIATTIPAILRQPPEPDPLYPYPDGLVKLLSVYVLDERP